MRRGLLSPMPHVQEVTARNHHPDPRVDYRGALLPFARMDDGSIEWAIPSMLYDVPGVIGAAMDDPNDTGKMLAAAAEVVGGGFGSSLLAGPKRAPGLLGMNVWQGGPHKYGPEGAADSLQHIGKGEDALAYGWGRYDAGVKKTGNIYRDQLSRGQAEVLVDGKVIDFDDATFDVPQDTALSLIRSARNIRPDASQNEVIAAARKQMEEFIEYTSDPADVPKLKKAISWLDDNSERLSSNPTGYLYKHDLPDEDIARYLDWDAPLSEQPESVREIIAGMGIDVSDDPTGGVINNRIGNKWYDDMGGTDTMIAPQDAALAGGAKQAASEALGRAGIPGLKYYDGMSRNAGEGTRNYVTWDQDVLNRMKLLERNGEDMSLLAPTGPGLLDN